MDSLVQQLTEHFTKCIQLTLRSKSRENLIQQFQIFFEISLLFLQNETLIKETGEVEFYNFINNIVSFVNREKAVMEQSYTDFNKKQRFSPTDKQVIRQVIQNNFEKYIFY